ncbi:MAG: hypothetical protein V3V33_14580, partial [Candidatus Lokiarchaeia archaeon]
TIIINFNLIEHLQEIIVKIVVNKDKKRNFLKIIICITLFLTVTYVQIFNYLSNPSENEIFFFDNKSLLVAQGSDDDTTEPVITFVQPDDNNTRITTTTYRIIANVIDVNPPVYGNVTLQISNQTNFLFNATMNYDGENQWSFNWDNISLYPNYNIYKMKVWVKDSSPNENYSWSEEFYISLSISTGPSFLHFLLYILVVCLFFAGIVVYLNKKIYHKSLRKK